MYPRMTELKTRPCSDSTQTVLLLVVPNRKNCSSHSRRCLHQIIRFLDMLLRTSALRTEISPRNCAMLAVMSLF